MRTSDVRVFHVFALNVETYRDAFCNMTLAHLGTGAIGIGICYLIRSIYYIRSMRSVFNCTFCLLIEQRPKMVSRSLPFNTETAQSTGVATWPWVLYPKAAVHSFLCFTSFPSTYLRHLIPWMKLFSVLIIRSTKRNMIHWPQGKCNWCLCSCRPKRLLSRVIETMRSDCPIRFEPVQSV